MRRRRLGIDDARWAALDGLRRRWIIARWYERCARDGRGYVVREVEL